MAEARAKKQRAERHAKEDAELLEQAAAQEAQAAAEPEEVKRATKQGAQRAAQPSTAQPRGGCSHGGR
eukprot:6485156-Lingulodinium_polyedra.AAC.1